MAPTDGMPRRVNLGCGFDRREGYLNVDLHEFHTPDLVADVRDLSALRSEAFEEVLAIDVLEHLPRSDTAVALAEWFRVLGPRGRLVLQVPDITAIGRLLIERDQLADHELFLHHMYGTQAYNGDFHLAGFTDRTLIAALSAAGFGEITTYCVDRWLLVASAIKPAGGDARSSIATAFGQGVHPPEPDGAGATFRWCERNATVLIENVLRAATPVELRIRLAGHFDDSTVAIGVDGVEGWHSVEVDDRPVELRASLALPSDGLRIRLRSDSPAVNAPNDARDLRFRILGLEVRDAAGPGGDPPS